MQGWIWKKVYEGAKRRLWYCVYPKYAFRTLEVSYFLWFLKTKERRYSEIKAFLWDISQGSLTKQLRELESDGLIKREVFPEVPPRVEYSLTTKGREFIPILDMMENFGKKFGEKPEWNNKMIFFYYLSWYCEVLYLN